MTVLVLGSSGFIGRNLCAHLTDLGHQVVTYRHGESSEPLKHAVKACDYVVHAAGVSRSVNLSDDDYIKGNVAYTRRLLDVIGDKPLLYVSTLKTNEDSMYGRTKREAEELVKQRLAKPYRTYILRLGNVFGKWATPYHNSVVATFCHALNRDLPIKVNENSGLISFIYIDEIINKIISVIDGQSAKTIEDMAGNFIASVPELAGILRQFKSRDFRFSPSIDPLFLRYLYATYVSYKEPDKLLEHLASHDDVRGSFVELFHDFGPGQVSLNVSKPGIVKGGHYHHTKHEKYLLLSGHATVRLRSVGSDKVYTYELTSKPYAYLHIPPGYTHEIETTGTTVSKTLMWASELYDANQADTHPLKVKP